MQKQNKIKKSSQRANTKIIKYTISTNLKMQSKQTKKVKKKISHVLVKETLQLKVLKKTNISK